MGGRFSLDFPRGWLKLPRTYLGQHASLSLSSLFLLEKKVSFKMFFLRFQFWSASLRRRVALPFWAHPGWESCSPEDMVQAGRPALCASSETAGHEAHHSKTQLINCVCVCLQEGNCPKGSNYYMSGRFRVCFKLSWTSFRIFFISAR